MPERAHLRIMITHCLCGANSALCHHVARPCLSQGSPRVFPQVLWMPRAMAACAAATRKTPPRPAAGNWSVGGCNLGVLGAATFRLSSSGAASLIEVSKRGIKKPYAQSTAQVGTCRIVAVDQRCRTVNSPHGARMVYQWK